MSQRIVVGASGGRTLPTAVATAVARAAEAMVATEAEELLAPEVAPAAGDALDLGRVLRGLAGFARDAETLTNRWSTTIGSLLRHVVDAPRLPRSVPEAALTIPVPLIDLVREPAHLVSEIVARLLALHPDTPGDIVPGAACARRVKRALLRESGLTEEAASANPLRLKTPDKSSLAGRHLVEAYLGNTPLAELLLTPVPLPVPTSIRTEHSHIVGSTGAGKSILAEYLMSLDLPAVARGEASIVFIDNQGGLIDRLWRTAVVPPERIVLIDPHDIAYPPCLNLFDVNLARINRYDPLDRERVTNSVIELLEHVLGSLLADLSSKQSVPFRFAIRLLMIIPGATLHTFVDLMRPGATERYAESIRRLPPTARAFFETEFDSRQFNETKQQVLRRLYGILENQTFERLWSHPRSKLDLLTACNRGSLVLINTAKDLLKAQGAEILGRYFIAMLAQVAVERAIERDPIPCHVYIDECADYLARDTTANVLFEQARKANVAVTVLHQHLKGQLAASVLDSIVANTSIKWAGNPSIEDVPALSRQLRCDPELFADQAKGTFAVHARGITPRGVNFPVPGFALSRLPQRNEGELAALLAMNRERYAEPYQEPQPAADPVAEPDDFADPY
jgi:hypothetical protein